MRESRSLRCLFAPVISVLLASCGGGGTDAPTGNPPPSGNNAGSIVLTASAPTLTLAPGASQTIVVTVTRTGSFTGAVSLVAAPLPAGVTAVFQPAQVGAGAATSTLTITAGATSTAGSSVITISGTGTGVNTASVGLQFTISQPPVSNALFTITPSVSAYVLYPTGTLSHQPTISVTRNAGYTGAIAFSITGLPATVAAGITPASVTGNTATIVLVNAGVPNGTYNGSIVATGAGGGGQRTAPLQVIVGPSTTGNITWRMCTTSPRYPAFFVAVRDGQGAWSRVVPSEGGFAYSFNIASATGSVAWVSIDSGVPRTTVYNFTRGELTSLANSECTLYQNTTTRTATGQVSGVLPGELSLPSMAWWNSSTSGSAGGAPVSYSLQNLPAGPLDLVAVRAAADANFTVNPNRAIVRRGVNPASGGSNALLDFAAPEAFALLPTTLTVSGTNGQAFSVSQYFHTAGGTSAPFHAIPQNERTATTRTAYGVPLAMTVAGDLHQTILTMDATAPRRASRQVIMYGRTLADRAVSFGPVLPTPVVTAVSVAGAGLVRAQGTLPTEYVAGVTLDVKSTGAFAKFATVHASRGALGAGSGYDVTMPDLTAVAGWDTNWSIRPGDPTDWWVSGGGPILELFDTRYIFATTRRRWTGAQTGITAPTDGSTFYMARATGTITP